MEKYPNVVVPDHGRGFFGIGIYGLRTSANLGTLWRSAQIMKADFLFVIGKRYQTMRTDTMKSWKHIPLFEYDTLDHFFSALPKGAKLVGIELDERSVPLMTYTHPERAVYLLGAEDKCLPQDALTRCEEVVQIPG